MLRIIAITLTTLAFSSLAYANALVDACQHTAPDGSVTWTVMTGGSCDPMDVQGTCQQDRAGTLTDCETNSGL